MYKCIKYLTILIGNKKINSFECTINIIDKKYTSYYLMILIHFIKKLKM